MTPTLEDVCCARLPAPALAALAELRRDPEIRVTLAGEYAWVRWDAGNAAVLRRLLPLPGVELFARRDASWHRPGAHLPAFDVPADLDAGSIALARAVTPLPIRARGPVGKAPLPVRLGLSREARVREATAMRCTLADLGRWAEMAPTADLHALESVWAGEVALILGRRLPAVDGERFWGDRLLSPIGFRPEPDLPEPALCRALGVAEGAIVVLEADGFEVVPRVAIGPLSRAGVRLALGAAADEGTGGPPL
jgi:hypothetical protein